MNTPEALYTSLLNDLSVYIDESLLKVYIKRKDFPVNASPRQAAAISIARSFLKKWKHLSNDRRDSVAQLKFLECSKRAQEWELQLNTSYDEELYGSFKSAVWSFWHRKAPLSEKGCGELPLVDHPFDILREGSVGPGASIKGGGGDFYTKIFDSPLSCTSEELYYWYSRYVDFTNPAWAEGESLRKFRYGVDIVRGNRLGFVPKNDETSRTICVEPTLNMFYQLGFSHILERRLLAVFGINLADQQFKNRELARRGSIGEGLVTLDLESASDSISTRMLKDTLPADFFRWLVKLRSPETDVPGLGYRQEGMISTMGNGFTFSLQTMLFSCVVIAAARCRGFPLRRPRGQDWGNFGVNGDDIVVPQEIAGDVIRLLQILGFVLNGNKSFVEGPFRESCGGDFFHGVNIRGVYAKACTTQQDRYSVINQLNLFSTRTGIQLPKTVQSLLKTVGYTPVPRWEDASSGIQVPFKFLRDKLPISQKCQSTLYWRWVVKDRKIRIAESALIVPRGLRQRKWNPNGLFIAFLQRSVNSFSIGVRHDTNVYVRKRGVAPNWDQPQTVHPLSGWFPDQRWETAVYLNLYS